MSARRHLKKQPVDGVSIADRSCVFLSLGGSVLTRGPASSADTSANKIVYDAECTDGKAWSISPIDNNVGLKMYGGGLGTLPRPLSGGWTIEVRCFLTAAPTSSHIFGYHELYPGYLGSANGSRVGLLAYGGANNRNIYFWGEGADLDSGVEWDVSGGVTHVIVTHAPGVSSVTFYIRKGLTTSVVSGSLSGSLTNFTPEGIFTGSRQGSGSNPITGKISKQAIYAGCKTREQALALLDNPWLTTRGRRSAARSSTGGGSASVDGIQIGASAQSGSISAQIRAAGIQIGVAAQSGSIAGAPSPAGIQAGAAAQSLSLSNTSTVGGTVSAVATQSGDLFVRAEVGGAQIATALQLLALSYGSSVGGIMAGDAAHTLDLGLGLTLGGTQIAAAIQTGGIAPDVRIAGVQIGSAAHSMGLAGDAATLGGTQAADAAQSLVLTTVVRVTGEQIATAILAGSLTVDVRIGAVQGGVAQIVGDVSGAVRISATMAGAAAQSGEIQLAGEAVVLIPDPRYTVKASRRSFRVRL